ncbi:hypothetical protein GGF31_003158 [Allomyces arbusculus]|nr:hypothetical protein GGF31_003158 [Allomyces arbusculus]
MFTNAAGPLPTAPGSAAGGTGALRLALKVYVTMGGEHPRRSADLLRRTPVNGRLTLYADASTTLVALLAQVHARRPDLANRAATWRLYPQVGMPSPPILGCTPKSLQDLSVRATDLLSLAVAEPEPEPMAVDTPADAPSAMDVDPPTPPVSTTPPYIFSSSTFGTPPFFTASMPGLPGMPDFASMLSSRPAAPSIAQAFSSLAAAPSVALPSSTLSTLARPLAPGIKLKIKDASPPTAAAPEPTADLPTPRLSQQQKPALTGIRRKVKDAPPPPPPPAAALPDSSRDLPARPDRSLNLPERPEHSRTLYKRPQEQPGTVGIRRKFKDTPPPPTSLSERPTDPRASPPTQQPLSAPRPASPTLPVARTASPPRRMYERAPPSIHDRVKTTHYAPPPPPIHEPRDAARRLPANSLTHHGPAAPHAPPMPVAAAAAPARPVDVFPTPDPATAEWSATETDWRNEVVEWGINPRVHPMAKVVAQKCKEIVERHRSRGGTRGPLGEIDRSRQDRERERPSMRHGGGGGGGGGGYHGRGPRRPPSGEYHDRDRGHHSRDDREHGHGAGRRDERGHGRSDYRDDRSRGGSGYRDERGPPGRGDYSDERGYGGGGGGGGGGGDRRGHDRRH